MTRLHAALLHAAAPGLVLALALPGCGRFDRGPEGDWDRLARPSPEPVVRFHPDQVAGLPEPARRLLLRAVSPGTPLARAVELSMEGTIVLDPERGPLRLEAIQVLAPPDGFIWSARASGGLLRIRGFDRYTRGEGEMRWKLFGLVPVMRASGTDVTRSAAARLAMEGILLPSFLVPRGEGEEDGGVRWEEIDENHASFRVTIGGEEVVTTVEVDPEGRPVAAWADRWNEGQYERFDVRFSGEIAADGYRVPARVQAGWRLGDPDAYAFFDATISDVRFHP
jgi:hypothetical protein